jgi:O-antigen ligase
MQIKINKLYKLVVNQFLTLKSCAHPEPKLQFDWRLFQWGITLIPINALPAAFPIVIMMFSVWWQYWRKITRDRIGKGFLYFSGWLVIGCLWSINPLMSLGRVANYTPFIWYFLALRLILRTTEQLRRLAWIIVTGSIFTATIGIGQHFLNWSKKIHFVLLDFVFKEQETPGRMTATFIHANSFACYLAVALILGLVLWCELWQHQPWQQWQPKQKMSMGILSISIGLNLVCLFYTSSRNGWITALLTFSALMLFYGQRWIVIIIGAITSMVMGAAFAAEPIQGWLRQIVPYEMWARINGQMYAETYAQSRIGIWEYAWSLAQQKPWTGWGLQAFPQLYEAHTQNYLDPHDLWLMLAAEVGIPTTLVLIGLVGSIMFQSVMNLMRASSRDRHILFGYILAFSTFIIFNTFDVVFEPRLNILSWTFLSALCVHSKPVAKPSSIDEL